MKAIDKPKFVAEIREIYSSLDMDEFIKNPNNIKQIEKINRIAAIFRNFSSDVGEGLENHFKEFQRWARSGKRKEHIENHLVDMFSFISRKVEEMDIYEIDDKSVDQRERIIKNLKNDNLWVRTVDQGKDFHIIIGDRSEKSGEHVHFIVGQTGEIRIDPEDKAPQELVEKVVSITTKHGYLVKASTNGVQSNVEFVEEKKERSVPTLFITPNIGASGGPKGHFAYFTIKNVSAHTAVDITWGIRGFAFEWRPSAVTPFVLYPQKEKEVEFPISTTQIFNEETRDLNVFVEFSDINGNRYFARRELTQRRVPSGSFFELVANEIGAYHPPVLLQNDGVVFDSWDKVTSGDCAESRFRLKNNALIKIRISRTLLAVWGFSTDEQIKNALLELGFRKIRQMVVTGTVQDYTFTTHDYTDEFQEGFEGYKKLRENIG